MIRRLFDITLGIAMLIALSPLLVLVSIAILLSSPGKPFYGGWRVGKDGRRFRMWKFRSMVRNGDRIGGSVTTPKDPRVTTIGRFLRATKIDELPQFFNLILGDMTLVGPRPESPTLIERYSPEQRRILSVKPGITGSAQLFYTTDPVPDGAEPDDYYIEHLLDERVRLDLQYERTRTPVSDCALVLQTAMLMARSFLNIVSAKYAPRALDRQISPYE
jgi:lipopolysaccharide/colanic/teichoic acid biosynthesis glycosyltransferase